MVRSIQPVRKDKIMKKTRPRKSVCYLYLDYERYGSFRRDKAAVKEIRRTGGLFRGVKMLTNICDYHITSRFAKLLGYTPKARDRYKITIERIYQKPAKKKKAK